MDEALDWPARCVVALLLGLVMFGSGIGSVAAQSATPVSGVTPVPEPTSVVEHDGDPSAPVASPGAHMQTAKQKAPLVEAQRADATVVVKIQNDALDPLPGACLLAESQTGASSSQCDGREDGLADGMVTFALAPGEYNLIVTQAPQGYISGTNIPLSLGAGLTTRVTIDLQPGGRTVFINTIDENENPVAQTCVGIFADAGGGQLGEQVSSNCDAPSGDPGDGSIHFSGIAPGGYVAVQTRTPTGYLLPANTPFAVPTSGTGPVIVSVVSSSADTAGNLIVNKVDENGDPLAGACFAVYDDAGGGQRGAFVVQQCDVQGGADDGQLLYTDLDPGSYILVEYHAPDGYINGVERQVTVTANAPTTITIPNVPGGSDITIRKVDASTGALLTGACFVVVHDDGSGQPDVNNQLEGRCDDSDGGNNGITPFTGLAAGDYHLWEQAAPDGYRASAEFVPFSVDGTADSTITVENVPMTLIEQLIAVLIEILESILNGGA